MEPNPPTAQPPMATQVAPSTTTAKIVYVLYLLALVVGVTSIVGVVVAYVNRADAPEPLASHYRFQIRTFWIWLAYLLAGIVLTIAVRVWLVVLLEAIWLVVRCVKGLKALDERQPYPNVETWLW